MRASRCNDFRRISRERALHLFILLATLLLETANVLSQEACTEESILKCNENLTAEMKRQQFSPTEEHLDYVCGLMKDVVNCSTHLLQQCNSKSILNFYDYLIGGTRKVIPQLCEKDKPLRIRYMQHFDCFRNNSEAFTACSVAYHDKQEEIQKHKAVEERESLKQICCAFYIYTECTRSVPEGHCSKDAKDLVEELFRVSTKPMITLCSMYLRDRSECSNSTASGSLSVQSSSTFVAAGVTLVSLSTYGSQRLTTGY